MAQEEFVKNLNASLAVDKDVARELFCPLCFSFSTEPKTVDCPAGHMFCIDCIDPVLQAGDPCPCCRGQFTELRQVPLVVKNMIATLKWHCKNKDKDCSFTGTSAQLQEHLEQNCTKEEVPCGFSGCNERVQRGSLTARQKKCPRRPVECEHCESQIPFITMSTHLKTCPSFPVVCPKSCGTETTRAELKSHLKDHCPEEKTKCPIPHCGKALKRKEIDVHVNDADPKVSAKHLKLMLKEREAMGKKEKKDKNRLTDAIAQRDQLSSDLSTLKADKLELENKFALLEEERDQKDQEIRNLNSKDSLTFVLSLPDFARGAGTFRSDTKFESPDIYFKNTKFTLVVYPKGNVPLGISSVYFYKGYGCNCNDTIDVKFKLMGLRNAQWREVVQKTVRVPFSTVRRGHEVGIASFAPFSTLRNEASRSTEGSLRLEVTMESKRSGTPVMLGTMT
uniref:RING-type domain-containing protein n=1 Tax=Chromera velia CCMP2878 TaxID=1169474 RepID=A0A0G4FAK7_9ALVE|eukprot:Cvel_15895.t1-p1 / transcript=Cvel_15895.t1 / gene=Cvel_15895 / organism=Chromera_velia_CCMP2878 / gene_product=TNF receptor-associated factor 3, putative / transcript_product=TNF receptor-associated factor 3, putative / location=Cvel_scaffold1200:44641-46806(-) / protein_length=449 / sequence_SO=supercontig / SO=protein_coding / is_pseudo=false